MSSDPEGQVIQFPADPHAIEAGPEAPPRATGDLQEPGPEVVEAEFVDDDSTKPVPVDQPYDETDLLPWQQPDDRRRIIPLALTREHRGTALRWYTGYAFHHARYHAIRLPWHAGKALWLSPRGVFRLGRRLRAWVTVAEAQALKAAAVAHAVTRNLHDGHAMYHQADRTAAPKIRARRIVLATTATLILIGGLLAWFLAPGYVIWLLGSGVIGLLGYAGRPFDRPFISPAVVSSQYTKLTSDGVELALRNLGIAALSAKGAVIKWAAPIQRDGDGWRAEVDLPLGAVALDVVKVRHRLAGNLRKPIGCVWPEGVPDVGEHRLIIWVGDKDPAKKGKVRWPLGNKGSHDFFNRVPFGVDPRGRLVTVPLFQHNYLLGSMPGQGKSNTVICLGCGQALDPTVELWVHDLGKGDLDPFECISHRFTSGVDDESIAYAARSLRLLRAETMRRATDIKKVPKDMCPEGRRISREIADKRLLRLWPIVCIIDECHHLFGHPDYGRKAGKHAEDIIRLGRALGIVLILATQRPDKDALPTGVSGNVSIRFCLHVAGQVENDMILGTSAYHNGLRATDPHLRPEVDAGIGILKGAAPTTLMAKVAYFDRRTLDRVMKRARVLREAAGTLSGVAIGGTEDQEPSFEVASLLDDLMVVYSRLEAADRAGVWSQDLCTALEELRPELYSGWDADTLAAALRPYAVRTIQLHMPDEDDARRTRHGLNRALLQQALAVRARRRAEESS